MKHLAALVFFLAFISLSSAQTAQPSHLDVVEVEIVEKGMVESPVFRLERIAIELLMPQRTENQILFFDGETKKDDLGNQWAYVEARLPQKKFSYTRRFLLNVSAQKTEKLPGSYDIPKEVGVYLRSTENIQSDDPAIRSLAVSITNGSASDFERVARLAAWVHDNVEYVRGWKNESKDALWVLENRVGTCDEYATLFIALTRSIGIPARFVAGYYYGSGRWEEHAFSEVYLGGWVPVDPTNLDVGRVDAAHIRFAVSNENYVGSKIRVYGTDAERISWDSETEVKTLSFSEMQKLDYNLSLSADRFEAGESAVVLLKVKADEYLFLRASLQPCVSDFSFVELDGLSKEAFLEPGEEKILYWKAEITEGLEDNMRYNCPLVLNSKHLGLGEAVLNVSGRKAKKDAVVSAQLGDQFVPFGGSQAVFLQIRNARPESPVKVGVLSGDFLQEFYVDSSKDLSVSFKPDRVGRQEVVVYTSDGSVLSFDYSVGEAEDVYIKKIELPSFLLSGSAGAAKVYVAGGDSTSLDLKLSMLVDSTESVRRFSAANASFVSFPLEFSETGTKKILFRLEGAGTSYESLRSLRVYDVPELEVDAAYLPHRRAGFVEIQVSGDLARNIRIEAGNESVFVSELFGEGTYEFGSAAENGVLKVTYEDVAGKSYAVEKSFETRREGFLEMLLRTLGEFIRSLLGFA